MCVADRQNGRIQCFDLKGSFIRQMHPKEFGSYVYAVDYCPDHGKGILLQLNITLLANFLCTSNAV